MTVDLKAKDTLKGVRRYRVTFHCGMSTSEECVLAISVADATMQVESEYKGAYVQSVDIWDWDKDAWTLNWIAPIC